MTSARQSATSGRSNADVDGGEWIPECACPVMSGVRQTWDGEVESRCGGRLCSGRCLPDSHLLRGGWDGVALSRARSVPFRMEGGLSGEGTKEDDRLCAE